MEVAGVVLGAIPLCVILLESWTVAGRRISSFRRWEMKITRYKRLLEGHRHDLEIFLRRMLIGTVPWSELEKDKLYNLLEQDWTDDEHFHMVTELRNRHGALYEDFKELVLDLRTHLQTIALSLDLAPQQISGQAGPHQSQLSNEQLMQMLRAQVPRTQWLSALPAKVKFAMKDGQIEQSLRDLADRVITLQNRMHWNTELQEAAKREKRKSASEQSARTREHLRALYDCLERTTKSIRTHQPLEIALELLTPSRLGKINEVAIGYHFLADRSEDVDR